MALRDGRLAQDRAGMTGTTDKETMPDPVMSQALEWVDTLISGEATIEDAAALKRWRAQSPAHDSAFTATVRLRQLLIPAAEKFMTAPSAPIQFMPRRARQSTPSMGRRAFLGGALAASAAGIMVVRPPFGLRSPLIDLKADYRTATGEQRRIALADGVSVELNTQTAITDQTDGNQPRIELLAGEAAITAKRSASTPFLVKAGDGLLRASQAEFNVRCRGSAISVTCLQGAVGIQHQGRDMQLGMNEQVSYDGGDMGAIVKIDRELAQAWQKGLLIFHDEPLSNVIDELNRYRPGKIIVTSTELGQRRVNGNFQISRLDEVLDQIRKLGGTQVISLPGGIVLLS